MAIRDRAVLVIDKGTTDGPLEFHFTQHERAGSLARRMLIGTQGGQLFAALIDFIPTDIGKGFANFFGGESAGLTIDAGMGEDTFTVEHTITSGSTAQWGDGTQAESDPPTATSATYAHEETKADVLREQARTARTGSRGPATLHIGEFTDGSVTTDATDGLFDPIPVTILDVSPRDTLDDPSAVTIELTMKRVKELPDFIDVDGVIDTGFDALTDGVDTVTNLTTDLP